MIFAEKSRWMLKYQKAKAKLVKVWCGNPNGYIYLRNDIL